MKQALRTLVHHPRKLALRRVLFQIHLWAGVLLALYVVVIALSGAVLVFRAELAKAQLPATLSAYSPGHVAPLAAVVQTFAKAHPADRLDEIVTPFPLSPVFVLSARDARGTAYTLLADPVTGRLVARPRTWLDWVYDLHVYLLLGKAHGMQVNGMGAGVLLLLAGTGLAIWWPGVKIWARGLRISLGHRWQRVNYDAHSAIGFWTLLLVCWWAISGVYFGWYRQVSAAVAVVSPLQGMVSPVARIEAGGGVARAALPQILASAKAAAPGGRLYSLSDPLRTGATLLALVDRGAPGDFTHRDILTVSTRDAQVLANWRYGENKTAGDWFLWAMHPLHFGTVWGIAIKVVWAVCGVALAVLSLTGMAMYWNRYLRKRLQE